MTERGFEDRVVGSILGLALGDALGAPFEFRRAKDIPDPLPILDMAWRGGPAGSTTDDTAMARNLVRSLVDRRGFDPNDVVARHLQWLASGPPDVGNLTARVLGRLARASVSPPGQVSPPVAGAPVGLGALAEDAARTVWEERGPEVSAGNGSVMYCAPLGLAFASRPDLLFELAPRLSRLTSFDPRCGTAVLAVTHAVAGVARGDGGEEAVGASLQAV